MKLLEAACLKQTRFIEFSGGSSLWNKGTFSTQSGRFKGCTRIILSARMASIVTHYGILYQGIAQYVVLNLSPSLQVGIINVYGFNHTSPRATMWNHIAQTQLPEVNWVLVGDFNNIKSMNDKQRGSTKAGINTRKLEAWNKLLVRLGVRDAFHVGNYTRENNKAFTWSNAHDDATMIQTRIDRIYISPNLEHTGGSIEILPTILDISNHAGIVLYKKSTDRRTPRTLFFNKGFLQNEDNKHHYSWHGRKWWTPALRPGIKKWSVPPKPFD